MPLPNSHVSSSFQPDIGPQDSKSAGLIQWEHATRPGFWDLGLATGCSPRGPELYGLAPGCIAWPSLWSYKTDTLGCRRTAGVTDLTVAAIEERVAAQVSRVIRKCYLERIHHE
jgi:hypothetical protein